MENIDVDYLRGLLTPSILEWLTKDKPLINGLFGDYANMDEFFGENLHT